MKILEDIDISSLLRGFERLSEALLLEKTDIVRDACIQRFEFNYELVWKTLRRILLKRGLEANSPKMVFRLAAKEGLIDSLEQWFNFVNYRNNTTHVYNEQVADEIYNELPHFAKLCGALITRLKSSEFI